MLVKFKLICLVLGTLILSSCFDLGGDSNNDMDSLIEWMKSQRQSSLAKKEVKNNLILPDKFINRTYLGSKLLDPFNNLRLTLNIKLDDNVKNSELIEQETTRYKDFLETYPLSDFTMVGSIKKEDGLWQALFEVQSFLYMVKKGNYLGKDFGLVTKITDDSVYLRELVQDQNGSWSEREKILTLQVKD